MLYLAGWSGRVLAAPTVQQEKVLQNIGFDQKLDAQIPLDLSFRDEQGQTVELRRYFGDRPVILALVYYECPMLCTLILNGLVSATRTLSLDPGKDYRVVAVSFNPREKPLLAARKKQNYLKEFGRADVGSGWAFLTGDETPIQKLTEAAGFKYIWDPELKQYAHASGIVVLTPQGKISKYFYGVEYPPKALRLALVDASSGAIGTPVDKILLYCYHYDPVTGKYGLAIMRVLRISAAAAVAALAGLIYVLERRRRKRLQENAHA